MKKNVENRFGSIAVDKGFISASQLIEALTFQAKENIEQGKHTLLGEILVEKGYMTDEQVEKVLNTMSQAMIYTLSAGR